MKKYLLTTFLGLLAIMAAALPVLAATTMSLSPATVNVTAGQTFNLSVAVDPQGVKNYTVKLELKYPADLLEVKSFTLGSNWMAVSQTGYDSIDNINGILIKTAGYPGGLTANTAFGTVSFSAKKAGSGIIQTGTGSLALNASSQNVFSGSAQANVTITAVTLPPPPPPPPSQTTTPPTAPPAEEEQVPPSAEQEPTPPSEEVAPPAGEMVVVPPEEKATEVGLASMLAAIGIEIGQSVWKIIIVILCLAGLILIGVREWKIARKKKRKGNV